MCICGFCVLMVGFLFVFRIVIMRFFRFFGGIFVILMLIEVVLFWLRGIGVLLRGLYGCVRESVLV